MGSNRSVKASIIGEERRFVEKLPNDHPAQGNAEESEKKPADPNKGRKSGSGSIGRGGILERMGRRTNGGVIGGGLGVWGRFGDGRGDGVGTGICGLGRGEGVGTGICGEGRGEGGIIGKSR